MDILCSVAKKKKKKKKKKFTVLSKNLITLSFCDKILWSIVSNAFCRSTNIILVNKPSSNPFKTLFVKKDKHRFFEWLLRKRDW